MSGKSRRTVLLDKLDALVQSDVDHESEHRRKKLDEPTFSARTTRMTDNKLKELFHFQAMAFNETMVMLQSYDTETLEQVWLSFTQSDHGRADLHSWRAYNGKEWNKVTGVHREEMFRDMLALRFCGWLKAEHRVHALLETYRALEMAPGGFHVMPFDELQSKVVPVFYIASASRSVVWLRRGDEARITDSKGRFTPPVEPKVHEDYTCAHLTPEAIEYVFDVPKGAERLMEYMVRKRETLMDMDFELFRLQQEAHVSITDGVL